MPIMPCHLNGGITFETSYFRSPQLSIRTQESARLWLYETSYTAINNRVINNPILIVGHGHCRRPWPL